MEGKRKLINVIDLTWRSDLAYAVGLLASDGYLRSDCKEVAFSSRDKELVEKYRNAIQLQKNICRTSPSGTSGRRGWLLHFKSRQFHDFLGTIGITSAKSRTIASVAVPDEFFADFFRGVFDGDGTFWTCWDTRWPNSFVFHIEISSASTVFIRWLQGKLHGLYGVKGYIKNGKGVEMLRYTKGDSIALFRIMYNLPNALYLTRKYAKIQKAIDFDRKLKQNIRTPW